MRVVALVPKMRRRARLCYSPAHFVADVADGKSRTPPLSVYSPQWRNFFMLIEIGIGFVFAFLFVAAYLLVSKLVRGNDERPSWRKLLGSSGERSLEAKPSKLFLTTKEMREHHVGQKRAGRNEK